MLQHLKPPAVPPPPVTQPHAVQLNTACKSSCLRQIFSLCRQLQSALLAAFQPSGHAAQCNVIAKQLFFVVTSQVGIKACLTDSPLTLHYAQLSS